MSTSPALDAETPSSLLVARGGVVWLATRRGWWLWAALVMSYLALWGAAALLPTGPTDLEVFFWPGAMEAASGHPFTIYHLRYSVTYPNANGPVSLFPLTLVAMLARALGVASDFGVRRVLVLTIFAIFPLLLSREALLAVARLTSRRLSLRWTLAGAGALLLAPALWQGMLGYGHIELALMIWLLLLAVRQLAEGRPWLTGILLALAVLTRASAITYCAPLTVLMLSRGQWKSALSLVSSGLATGVVALAPYLIASPANTVYSLVSFHALLPVGHMTLSSLLLRTAWEPLVMAYDSLAVLVASLAVVALALLLRRDLDIRSPDVYALLAACGLCFPLLIKTLWPYYYYECFVLLVIWWLAQRPGIMTRARAARWAAGGLLPATLLALALASDYMISLTLAWPDTERWSQVIALGTLGVLLTTVVMLCLSRAGVASHGPASPDGPVVAL
ncbi:MAG TPA: hypothetical protein VF807_14155 [Ktedonobacterales bacterium]